MRSQLKKWIGLGLLNFCDRFPRSKRRVQRLGLRTSREWFGSRIVRVQLPDGRSFKLASLSQNYLSFELFWRGAGYYEPITTLVAQELVRAGDTFVDVGANIGFYSLVLALREPALKVIAFEPNPKNYALLKENVQANRRAQITCEPLALSDREGTAVLYLSASDMSASLQSDFDGHPTGAVEVRTTTLDDYLAQKEMPGRFVIKVDVEGHEESFFEGARRTIALRSPDIITEVTFNYAEEPVAFLKEKGYRFYQITDHGLRQSEALTPVIREPFVFLNYLLSARPKNEIADLFDRIRDKVGKIDLTQTSKCVSPEMIQKLRSRQSISQPRLALHPTGHETSDLTGARIRRV